MPKNMKGGKKFKKSKKMGQDEDAGHPDFREEGQEYARVVKCLGDCRLDVELADKRTLTAHIRGKLRKRVWIRNGDIVLVSLRDFDENKADVIGKYSDENVQALIKYGEITTKFSAGGNVFDVESSDEELAFEDGDYDVDNI